MPADRDIVFRARAPFAGLHHELAIVAANAQHVLGRIVVEFAMQPADEIGGGRFGQAVLRRHPVDVGLDADMSGGLDLQVASFLRR